MCSDDKYISHSTQYLITTKNLYVEIDLYITLLSRWKDIYCHRSYTDFTRISYNGDNISSWHSGFIKIKIFLVYDYTVTGLRSLSYWCNISILHQYNRQKLFLLSFLTCLIKKRFYSFKINLNALTRKIRLKYWLSGKEIVL